MFAYMCVRWVEGCFNLAPAGGPGGIGLRIQIPCLVLPTAPWSTPSQNNTNTIKTTQIKTQTQIKCEYKFPA